MGGLRETLLAEESRRSSLRVSVVILPLFSHSLPRSSQQSLLALPPGLWIESLGPWGLGKRRVAASPSHSLRCSSCQPPCRSTQGLRLCCPLYLESSPHRSPASLPLFLGSLFKCHLIKCHLPQPPREKGRPSFPTSCTSHPWPCCFSSSYSSPPDSLHVYFSTSCVFNIENSKNSIYFRLSCLLRASEDEHGCTWQSSGSCSLQGKRKTKHSCGDCQGPRMSPF